MGILGLLQGVKYASVQGNIQDFKGQSVAVDASSWLHKSVYSIADHYVETTERTNAVDARCVASSSRYMIKRCEELLQYAGIHTVHLVMDGKRCPLKAVTNQDRERKRQENLSEARRYQQAGNRDKMYEKYKACIKVRSDLTQAVMQAVAQRFRVNSNNARGGGDVQLVWAPYEADAQLVKLCMDGKAQAVITEDSDIMVYSVACQVPFPILFKLDRNNGSCDIISMDFFLSSPNQQQTAVAAASAVLDLTKKPSGLEPVMTTFMARQARDPGLRGRLFVQACVLAGCDYCPNLLNGVGLVTAFKHVRSAIHRTSEDRYGHVLKLLSRKARADIELVDYEELLSKSEAVFYYHPVCEADGRIVFLRSPTEDCPHRPNLDRFGGDLSFLGNVTLEGELVQPVRCNPMTIEPAPSASFFAGKRPRPHQQQHKAGVPKENSNTVYAAGSRDIVAVANPYRKTKKHKPENSRKPLLASSPNLLDSKDKLNPFAKFARGGKENTAGKSSLEQLLGRSEDVRFVKRSFPKDGSRSLLPKPVAPSVKPLLAKRDSSRSLLQRPAVVDKLPKSNYTLEDLDEIPEAAPTPLKALSQPSFDYGNDEDCRDNIEEDFAQQKDVNSHSPPSSDRLSAPFGNPSFHNSDNCTQSKYFGKGREYVRRVTEELELDGQPSEPDYVIDVDTADPRQQRQNRPPTFDFYDDFLSDKSASDQEDIVESSPETTVNARPNVASLASKSGANRGPKSLVAKSKPLRFRIGGPSTVARAFGSISHGFQRQRDTTVATQPAKTSKRRGPLLGSKQRAGRPAKKHNSLLSHFTVLARDKKDDA